MTARTVLVVSDELRDQMIEWAENIGPVLAEADAVQAQAAALREATR